MNIDAIAAQWLSGGGILGLILFLAAKYLPQLLSSFKRETLDQTTVDAQAHAVEALDARLTREEARGEKADERIRELNDLVHKQQIRLTRFVSVFIKLEAYIDKDIVPQAIIDELDYLIRET